MALLAALAIAFCPGQRKETQIGGNGSPMQEFARVFQHLQHGKGRQKHPSAIEPFGTVKEV